MKRQSRGDAQGQRQGGDGMMEDRAVHVLEGHTAEPERPPRGFAKISHCVAGNGDKCALDRVHLVQIFGEEELLADKRVYCEEQGGDACRSQLRGAIQGFSIPRYFFGSSWWP